MISPDRIEALRAEFEAKSKDRKSMAARTRYRGVRTMYITEGAIFSQCAESLAALLREEKEK